MVGRGQSADAESNDRKHLSWTPCQQVLMSGQHNALLWTFYHSKRPGEKEEYKKRGLSSAFGVPFPVQTDHY